MNEKWRIPFFLSSLSVLSTSQTEFFGSWSEVAFVLALLLGFILPGGVDIYQSKRQENVLLMIGFIAFSWGLGLVFEQPHLILDQTAKLPLFVTAVVSLALYLIAEPIMNQRRSSSRR